MAKKPSGLGRAFGDLLDDNSLEIKTQSSVVLRGESKAGSGADEVEIPPLGYAPKSLYEEKPKRSIKANFKK
ncbi:MAG: hypothetical protein J6Q82_01415 [Clostridia bacterium]|nr:hypothetical protein [Clostridia bacterium]